jgi:hypothetical protein
MNSYIEIPVHVIGTITLLAIVLALRLLLDLEMGIWVVRILHRIPMRGLFRHRYVSLKGDWEHVWEGETGNYLMDTDRHGQHYMYQLFRWVYAGTRSRGKVFAAFGRIQGDYLIGRWYDKNDENGYFGAFQLRIVDGRNLKGKWIGHSKQNPALIRSGDWSWTKLHD